MPPGPSPCRGTMHFGRYLVRSGLMAGPSSRDHLLRHTISVPSSSFLIFLVDATHAVLIRTHKFQLKHDDMHCLTHPLTSFKEESDLAKASNPLPTCNHPEKKPDTSWKCHNVCRYGWAWSFTSSPKASNLPTPVLAFLVGRVFSPMHVYQDTYIHDSTCSHDVQN